MRRKRGSEKTLGQGMGKDESEKKKKQGNKMRSGMGSIQKHRVTLEITKVTQALILTQLFPVTTVTLQLGPRPFLSGT